MTRAEAIARVGALYDRVSQGREIVVIGVLVADDEGAVGGAVDGATGVDVLQLGVRARVRSLVAGEAPREVERADADLPVEAVGARVR